MSSETRIVLRLPHCSVRLQAKKVLQTKFAAPEMDTGLTQLAACRKGVDLKLQISKRKKAKVLAAAKLEAGYKI